MRDRRNPRHVNNTPKTWSVWTSRGVEPVGYVYAITKDRAIAQAMSQFKLSVSQFTVLREVAGN